MAELHLRDFPSLGFVLELFDWSAPEGYRIGMIGKANLIDCLIIDRWACPALQVLSVKNAFETCFLGQTN